MECVQRMRYTPENGLESNRVKEEVHTRVTKSFLSHYVSPLAT
jgi:hypothetical protein